MDPSESFWHYSSMMQKSDPDLSTIPSFTLLGEKGSFPDLLHCEKIAERAGLHDWNVTAHRHFDLHQVFLIRSGDFSMSLDGTIRAIKAPAMVNIPPRTVHSFVFERGTDGYVLTLPVADFPEVLGDGGVVARRLAKPFVAVPPEGAEEVIRIILNVARGRGATRALRLRGLTIEALCLLAETPEAAESSADVAGRGGLIGQFEQLVAEHLRDRWLVSDYAKALGVSAAHLSRLARQAAGVSAGRLIESALFREACRELAYTRKRAETIGYELGFQDPSYFSRAFRRVVGVSPLQYRQSLNASGRAALSREVMREAG